MIPSGWTLKRVVDPEIEPVTLEQAKAQCRVDPDITDSDDLLNLMIAAAREEAEEFTKRAWIESTWLFTLPAFPIIEKWWADQRIRFPRNPVIAIDSFSYLDWDGNRIAMAEWDGVSLANAATSNNYWPLLDDEPAALEPPFACFWPVARPQARSVQIQFRAGYASAGSPVDAANVPNKAKQAMLMLVSHWYENRESVIAGPRWTAAEVPYSFERALDSLRIYGEPTR